jgi:hypothetical protein
MLPASRAFIVGSLVGLVLSIGYICIVGVENFMPLPAWANAWGVLVFPGGWLGVVAWDRLLSGWSSGVLLAELLGVIANGVVYGVLAMSVVAANRRLRRRTTASRPN